jgi:transposase
VDTRGHLLTLRVTRADQQDRARVRAIAGDVREVTRRSVNLAFVDQGHTGGQPAAEAKGHEIERSAATLPEAKRGFVLPPRRWVVERRFTRMARFRRLATDSDRLLTTIAGLHLVVFACQMHNNLPGGSP